MKRIYILFLVTIICVSVFSLTVLKEATVKTFSVSSGNLYKSYPTIVLDAGHGGEDGGTTSTLGEYEKDINLDICLVLEKFLRQSGFNVKMIRDSDCSIHDINATSIRERKVTDIRNRVELANSDNNNILISIHQNHFSESQYFGTQIFFSKNNTNSQLLAENIRTAVTTLIQPDNTRKCKQSSNVYLLDNATVPAVIVECGFLSNPDEAYLLSKDDYKESMAYCIYLGILEYIYLYN